MPKKQIIFIHGGNSYSKYEDYLESLRMKIIDDPLDERVMKKWRTSIREVFADSHEVYYPQMPNGSNARYVEWKIWFERYHEFLRDGVTLIGHSLGGFFLAKYLTEETMPVKVKSVYLVAAPFETDDFDGEDCRDFAFEVGKLHRLAEQVGGVFIFHSEDDPVVPYAHALKYKDALPNAELISFTDKNHFKLEEFPEFIEHLKAVDGV